MALKLTDLQKKTREATFEYQGETVSVRYRPSALTARVQMVAASMVTLGRDLSDEGLAEEEKSAHLMASADRMIEALGDYTKVLTEMIAEWDVLGPDGKAVPITVELVRDLPLTFVYELFGAIMRANNPNAESVKS